MDRKTRLKVAMLKKRITVSEAAKRCGYTTNTMYKYLSPAATDKVPPEDKVRLIENC